MDWHSRKVLAFRLSNTLDADFCVDALKEALDRYGPPEIFNTDQGAQFTSQAFIETLKSLGVTISMDGRGRVLDNIFIERLWWTVKYHYVYLHTFDSGIELRRGLTGWFEFYNNQRPHQGLDDQTPDEVYFGSGLIAEAA
jgi:putative transposase